MKEINSNLVMQRVSAHAVDEVQKSLGISQTMRLRVDPDNFRFWLRTGDTVRVLPHGDSSEHRVTPPIEITFDWARESCRFWCDSVYTLIRPERQFDFDLFDLPDAPSGEINVEVNLQDAVERIAIWEALPPNPRPNGPNSEPPTVVGM